ncbi:MAG: response regulator transcription factor [Lachnospiraceae bacterium]|nr:response regulator transcription factor [Lachnospiraceae bacterium]
MSQETILVADDDREIVRAIKRLLEMEGYHVLSAYNGLDALEQLVENEVHLIILDIMMPKLDGLSAMMKIRENKNIPILLLSAKTEESDKVLGLSMGADDYISKPYQPAELVARVKSSLRRYLYWSNRGNDMQQQNIIENGSLSLNLDEKQIYVDGEAVKLTATEYRIVELLMKNRGRVFSAEEIYERVWKEQAFATENTVMVHIRRIREKIEINPKVPKYLKVVWGIGYKMEKY